MLSHCAIVNTSLLGGLHSFSLHEAAICSLCASEEATGVGGVCLGAISSSLFTLALISVSIKVAF